MGRPTDYRPQFCEEVIELGKLGKSKAQMAAALDCSRDSIDQWCKDHQEFSGAIARARERPGHVVVGGPSPDRDVAVVQWRQAEPAAVVEIDGRQVPG